MASTCTRIRPASLSSLRSCIKPRALPPPPPRRAPVPAVPASPATPSSGAGTSTRRFTSLSRFPSQLGCCCCWSMFPLHSAVAAARLTSRLSPASQCCRALSQDGIDGT